MKLLKLASLSLALLFTLSSAALAQDRGYWRAASKTARSITGDISVSELKVTLNFSSFTIAQIRDLQPNEITAAFNAEAGEDGTGNLYRLSIPAEKHFLHKNTLCGSEETQWMVTYAHDKSLQVAFFSGASMPVLTPDAMANATNLCGTYLYVR